jgi:hypothetical protein
MKIPTTYAVLTLASLLTTIGNTSAEPPAQQPLTDFGKLKDGDLVFIESKSARAPAIKALTEFDLTHCGIVFNENEKWMVYEGAGRPGSYLELADWIDHESGAGEKHALYVRRLIDRERRLAPKLKALKTKAKELHDTKYDFGFAWSNRDKSNKELIYCSELIWKAYHDVPKVDLGQPHALADYIERPPAGKSSTQVEETLNRFLNSSESKERRDGQPYKRDELAISPKEVFESAELEAVVD